MKRYIFSKGEIHVEEGIDLAPEKRTHPLGTTVLLIAPRFDDYNKKKPRTVQEEFMDGEANQPKASE